MNQREQPSAPRGALALPCLAVLLLPLMAVTTAECGLGLPPPIPVIRPRPYLAIVGAPPLRFSEPVLPPEPIAHLSSASTPNVSKAGDPNDPSHDVSLQPSPQGEPTGHALPTSPTNSQLATGEAAPTQPLQPIIPDDVRPRVRPEDFLPYFRIPVVQPEEMNAVPAPRSAAGPLPASSATYTQTPR